MQKQLSFITEGRDCNSEFQNELLKIVNSAIETSDKIEKEAENLKILRQITAGKCDLIPYSFDAEHKPIKSHIPIDRFPVFVVDSYSDDYRELILSQYESSTESRFVYEFLIGKESKAGKARGVLKTSHQEFFYKILNLWNNKGFPVSVYTNIQGKRVITGCIDIPEYELACNFFNKCKINEQQYTFMRDVLRDLASIPICYRIIKQKENSDEIIDDVSMTLLESYSRENTILKRFGNKTINAVSIHVSHKITEDFLSGRHVKNFLFEPFLNLSTKTRRPEIARLLYPYLDYELFHKNSFHTSLIDLSKRLGLIVTYPSKLKDRYQSAVKLLSGIPIRGGYLRVRIRKMKDNKNDMLVADKLQTVSEI